VAAAKNCSNMTELSGRAKNFLTSQKRFSSTVIREDIIESFIANNAPVFEPLIEFQQKYSGCQFMAGLEPVCFGLLQGDGGCPVRTGTAVIEYRSSEKGLPKWQFVCATSQYQMSFTLDEYGRYYEEDEIVASSFDKVIEHLSVWDELKKKEGFRLLLQNQKLNIQELDKKLGLSIMPEASDEYTLWFKNEFTYLTQCGGKSTIITSENFDKIKAQISS
jgi:hypothetical protein